ncbi:hypothetical protein U2F10_35415 [Leptothoe sp. EHU-05/26/07-4]
MQEISDILATFHDGGIEGFKVNHSELELKIGCAYLAEIEKEGNEYFFLTITDVDQFEFHHWNGTVTKGLKEIIDLDLEIGYSKIEDTIVKTACNVWNYKEGDSGGELWIKANYKSLKNQDKEFLKPETLYKMSSTYWNGITK